MAISTVSDSKAPLRNDVVDGCVDFRGRTVHRSNSGGWRSAAFIIVVEMGERFAYLGIVSNLITYLTGQLGQSTVKAAKNVNVWAGTATLLPLLGAFVADSFLGRYRTIVVASVIYILGLGLLTLSAMLPWRSTSDCKTTNNTTSCSPSEFQVIFFFLSLYLVAIGQGGHKPCVQAFGADQFDGKDPEECKAKSSFFNWWYFGLCGAVVVASTVLIYIQDNLNWGFGFGIPCCAMVFALVIFLLGTKTYRYTVYGENKGPFKRIGQVFLHAVKNRRTSQSAIALEEEAPGIMSHQGSQQFKFLNKALLASNGSKECSIAQVEEAKALLRLVPIWTATLMYGIVFAQISTFFTKQGVTMDRSITPGFKIPPASLQTFVSLSTVLAMPIYDRILVPLARSFTSKPAGITMLQRIGTGIFMSIISMVIAALVEIKRLKTAREYKLVDTPHATIPMSVWWLIPQYAMFGIADVFTMVGLQEFFYDQVPTELRSVGLSLFLSIFGVGNFLSSFLISIIEKATERHGQTDWFVNNLNQSHLDYFYWLLAGLSAVAFVAYLYFAKSYIYNCRAI